MTPKKVVISASARLQDEIMYWRKYWEASSCHILDYPKPIPERDLKEYEEVYSNFIHNLAQTDILFVLNSDRDGQPGYVGAQTFAEIAFVVANNRLHRKQIQVVLMKPPGQRMSCSGELDLWLKLGWIRIFKD